MDQEQKNSQKLKTINDEIEKGCTSERLIKLRKKLYRIDVSNDSCSDNQNEKYILLQCIKEFLENDKKLDWNDDK